MRILFTFVGGNGHFQPLVPIARACADAGHSIAFAGGYGMAETVKAHGFTVYPIGTPPTDANDAPERIPLRPPDPERDDWELRENFARRGADVRASGLLPLCDQWQPDLIVCDEVDFGAMIVGEKLGIPYASVLVIASGSFVRTEIISEPLNALRAKHHLSPDPDLHMLTRYLVISPIPPSYRDPNFPLPATGHTIRPQMPAPKSPNLPFALTLPDAPTIYFTLGTIFNTESGDLFTRVLDGLRDLPVNLIVTTGKHIDPAEFGTQPANVHIHQYIPQDDLLPHCDLVISHGGSGSVIGTLAHGLPMVLIPMGADQPRNAERCQALGVAQVLDAVESTPDIIRETVVSVLNDPTYKHNARRIQAEIATLPPSSHAVTLLERLHGENHPDKQIG